jgi:hypothetical protein
MTLIQFPAQSAINVTDETTNHNFNIVLALQLLMNLPYVHVSDIAVASASASTTINDYFFIAPNHLNILSANFIMTTVQTGAGNLPTIQLVAGGNTVGQSAGIALAGAIGSVTPLVINPTYQAVVAGTVLQFQITNPAGTITVPLQGKLQIVWNAIP